MKRLGGRVGARSAPWGMALFVAVAPALGGEPKTIRLANGMRIVLHAAKRAPKAAIVLVYSIGEAHDPAGRSGMAHLMEHCYVTAAAGEIAAGDVQQYVARYPDGWNAQTGERYTVIASVVVADRIELELREAAMRMANLRIAESDLVRERPRMTAELANMYGGIPKLAAQNHARAAVCPAPEGARKGGVDAQIATITPAALQERHARYYKPRNAVLCIAGGFDAAATEKLVRELFGAIPAGDEPPAPRAAGKSPDRVTTVEVAPPRFGEPVGQAGLAFAAPAPDDAMYAPFLVLTSHFMQQSMQLRNAEPGSDCMAVWMPLDDPEVVKIAIATGGVEDPAARLRELVREWCTFSDKKVAGMVQRARSSYSFFLGLQPVPDAWLIRGDLYGVALGHARRLQMGLDPASIDKALCRVRPKDLHACAKAVFGSERGAVAVIRIRE